MFSRISRIFREIDLKSWVMLLSGSFILAFGLYNIHSQSGVTEGGVLGLILLLDHWIGLSPSVSSLVMNAACYVLGLRVLGWNFIVRSGVASLSFSAFYAVLERFPRIWPGFADMPLLAAVVGAMFVGFGVGICVLAGGAPGGDDALAMSVGRLLHCNVQWVYLAADIVVLLASLSYIPLRRIAYSLLTVILSGAIIGQLQRMFMSDVSGAAPEPEAE